MKKMIAMLTASAMMLSAAPAVYAGDVTDMGLSDMGVTAAFPESMKEIPGELMVYPASLANEEPDVYASNFVYYAMSDEEIESLNSLSEEELTDEMQAEIQSKVGLLGCMVAVDGGLEELKVIGLSEEMANDTQEIGKGEKFAYFFVPEHDEDYLSAIGEYADSFNAMQESVIEALKSAEYGEPVNQKVDLSGQKFEFETQDLDGNEVTSAEIFGQNEITMVNYWGTWCHYCVEEMEELAAINTRLKDVNCGIIGILQDASSEGKIDLAKEIMAEKGTNYPVLIPTDDMEILKSVTSFPTSFYVDKNGNIVGKMVMGADVSRYESDIMALLEANSGESEAAAEAESKADVTEPAEDAAQAEAAAYRVIVTDEEGNPVEGAMVQFCDDTSCTIGETDEAGVAVFEKPEGVYEVHVEEAPEGFAEDGTVVNTPESYGDVTLVLKREA